MSVRYTEGPGDFLRALDDYELRDDAEVEMVVDWAQALEDAGLAHQRSTIGESSRALRVELPNEGVSLVTVWRNKHWVNIALEGTVFLRKAPLSSQRINARVAPKRLKDASTYPIRPYAQELLDELAAAYREAST